MNEKIYRKKVLIKAKRDLEEINGIVDAMIIDEVLHNYDEISKIIHSFYSYDSFGYMIITHDNNRDFINRNYNELLQLYMGEKLNYDNIYYISYEIFCFIKFKFSNFLEFIISWKKKYGTYDLTIFNEKEVFVINDNEYNISIHYLNLKYEEFQS